MAVRYLPDFLLNSRVISQNYQAELMETDLFKAKIEELKLQANVDTATWGIKYWEQTLNLPVDEAKPIDERRSLVKSKLRGVGVVTPALIQSVAESFAYGDVEVTEFSTNKVYGFDKQAWAIGSDMVVSSPKKIVQNKVSTSVNNSAEIVVSVIPNQTYAISLKHSGPANRWIRVNDGDSRSAPTLVNFQTALPFSKYTFVPTTDKVFIILSPYVATATGTYVYEEVEIELVKGDTNLLGQIGSAELVDYFTSNGTMSVDTTHKSQGNGSLKVVSTQTSGSCYTYPPNQIAGKVGDKYVMIVEYDQGTMPGAGWSGTDNQSGSITTTKMHKYGTAVSGFNVAVALREVTSSSGGSFMPRHFFNPTALGQYAYYDAWRMYKVSDAEYSLLLNMSAQDISVRYPFREVKYEPKKDYTVGIDFVSKKGVPSNISDIEKAIRDILPAHLIVEFIYHYLTWNEWDAGGKTWDATDALNLNWDAFDMYEG